MATPAENRAVILSLIEYLEKGSAGKFIDERTITSLARIFGETCGFRCGCPGTFQEGMRDAPFATLLRVLTCPDVSGIALAPDSSDGLGFGGTADFGILAGTTITNTGATVITGDLGLSPGSDVTGFPPGSVLGDTHITDAEAAAAQIALTAQYLDLAGRASDSTVGGDIGGQTLDPGVYTSASSLEVTTADLTLDAGGNTSAVFIFQIGSTLTIANGRQIILAGGAQAGNIYWQVGSSATIGTTVIFNGTIVALTSISVNTSATINGRLLARNGAVTLAANSVVVPT